MNKTTGSVDSWWVSHQHYFAFLLLDCIFTEILRQFQVFSSNYELHYIVEEIIVLFTPLYLVQAYFMLYIYTHEDLTKYAL